LLQLELTTPECFVAEGVETKDLASMLDQFRRIVFGTSEKLGCWPGCVLRARRRIAVRTCEGMSDIFTILYVTNVSGITIPLYGVLVAVQLATAILVYIPSAKIADRFGRKPFVIATFVCFALSPVAVVLAKSFAWLVGAFVIGGLREIGENWDPLCRYPLSVLRRT
jgi:hypothetical protein